MKKYRKADAIHSKCDNCGGVLFYDISKNKFQCTHCGESQRVIISRKLDQNPFDFENLPDDLYDDSIDVIKCKNCAAVIILEDNLDITGSCPYCDSNYVSNFSEKRLIAPSSLIPFKVDRKEAEERFRSWVKKLKGEKRGFSKSVINTNVIQTYRPFWVFNAKLDVEYKYQARTIKNGRSVIVNSPGRENISLVNVGIDAMYNTEYSDRIESDRKAFQKYNFDELVDYDAAFLTGTQTSVYVLDLGEGLDSTRSLVGSELTKKHKGSASDFSIKYAINSKYSLALLPVWEARMVFDDEIFVYSLNAQTGVEFGEYPRNWMFSSSGVKFKVR